MKSKLFLAATPLLCLLLVGTVAAASAYSLRGQGGDLVNLHGDTAFSDSNIKFSAWSKPDQGKGSLNVIASTNAGEQVRLNLKLAQAEVLKNTKGVLKIKAIARGTYWKKGSSPQRLSDKTVVYRYNKNTGLTDVWGAGLNVQDIPTVVASR